MTFSTNKFGGNDTARNETLFTTGNGNLGFRGDTEEKAGTFHKGCYINGFYDSEPIQYGETAYGYAKNHETILNLPDPKRIELCVDKKRFSLGENVTSFKLELDQKKGMLVRHTEWKSGESSISLVSERLVSFTHEDCAVIRYTVTNTSEKDEKIALASCIDIETRNILAEDDPRIGAKFTHQPLIIDDTFNFDNLSFTAHTQNSGLLLAGCAINHLELDGKELNFGSGGSAYITDISMLIPSRGAEFTLPTGKSFTLTKFITYCHAKKDETDLKSLYEKTCRTCEKFAKAGFEKAAKEQADFLSDFWKIAAIDIEENEPVASDSADSKKSSLQASLHFNLFHLLQSAGRNGKVSIAAKGLTSEGYEGHFFWDTESYVCPVFTYTAPEVAKKLLEYRSSIFDKAKERAKIMSVKGALYPWRTISGEETSAYFPAGTAQYHINADIIFALNRFLNAHENDLGFDKDSVEKMTSETARMYASLGSFAPSKGGAFVINDVTGPDEYTAIVNNNAFTNLMARENLEISAKRAGAGATEAEKTEWKHIAENMYIPFDKEQGIYPQDDSFMDKADWDFENTPRSNYPLLLHYHPLVIYRHRVLKQPDLVLAQFLLSRRFILAEKIRNFDFYEKYTTGDSSLSHCIMSIMASQTGNDEKALDYFNKTVRMDIDDVNGNSRDGIHTACMAGSWMSVVYGFAGFEDYGGEYSFNPHLPKEWKKLSFSLAIRGAILDITLTQSEAVYFLREGSELELSHRNEKFVLKTGEKKSFSLKKRLGAVLFDLDGVVTDTAPLHFKAWKVMADEEGLRFDEEINKKLLGISREASLEVILKENGADWTSEKKALWCTKKNEIYKKSLESLSEKDILPGIKKLLEDLKSHGIKAGLASSSKNAPAILERLGISGYFSAIADASKVQKAKPEPDLFLEAGEKCGVWYTDCVGIEDAESGVKAIKKAGMKSVGIETTVALPDADLRLASTAELTYEKLLALF